MSSTIPTDSTLMANRAPFQSVVPAFAPTIGFRRSVAALMTVFAGTSHYSEQRSSPSVLVKLPFPTADPVELTRAAHRLLPLIENGIRYARAGIILTDLRPADAHQPSSCSAMRMKRPASRS